MTSTREDRLDSWKEIATFLNRGVRTVQRWEATEGLPVRRHQHRIIKKPGVRFRTFRNFVFVRVRLHEERHRHQTLENPREFGVLKNV